MQQDFKTAASNNANAQETYNPNKLDDYIRTRTVRLDLKERYGLTPSQLSLCSFMVQAKKTKRLATIHDISLSTCKDHLKEIAKKIGLSQSHTQSQNTSLLVRRCVTAPIDPDELPLIENLSRRELQVAALMVRGYEMAGIATKLGIKPSAACGHRTQIYGKLGITNREELFALMFVDTDDNEFPPTVPDKSTRSENIATLAL